MRDCRECLEPIFLVALDDPSCEPVGRVHLRSNIQRRTARLPRRFG